MAEQALLNSTTRRPIRHHDRALPSRRTVCLFVVLPSVERRTGVSFHLGDDSAGITRYEFLPGAIDDQVKVFEHDSPDQGFRASRLNDRFKN
jgi:hypothetical protein